jgi:hypothetical protein
VDLLPRLWKLDAEKCPENLVLREQKEKLGLKEFIGQNSLTNRKVPKNDASDE